MEMIRCVCRFMHKVAWPPIIITMKHSRMTQWDWLASNQSRCGHTSMDFPL